MSDIDLLNVGSYPDPDRKNEFEYVNPREALRNMDVRVIDLGQTEMGGGVLASRLVDLPDLDGRKRLVPYIYEPGYVSDIPKIVRDNARSIRNANLSQAELEILGSGMNEYGLPLLFATETLNNHNLLGGLVKPNENKQGTALIGFLGYAGTAKSTIMATLGLRFGVAVASLDQFSGRTPNDYLAYMQSLGFDQNTSAKDIIKAVGEFRAKSRNEPKTRKIAKTIRLTLAEMVSNLKDGNRPRVILVEGVSHRGPKDIRTQNIYDVTSASSVEGFFETHNPTNSTEVSADALDEVVGEFGHLLPDIEAKAHRIRSAIIDSIHSKSVK